MDTQSRDTLAEAASELWPDYTWAGARRYHGAFHELLQSKEGPIARSPLGKHAFDRATREHSIAQALGALDLPVKTPEYLDEPRESHGYVLTLMSKVPGKDAEDLNAMTDAKAEAYRVLLDAFARIDTTQLSGVPSANTWCGGESWHELITGELWDKVPREHQGKAREAIEASVTFDSSAEPVLGHGDFGPHNILWSQGKAVGLIDLDHAQIGDQALDVAPLVGFHGSEAIAELVPEDILNRALVYRALLPLKLAAAAHRAGLTSLRDHAFRNFAARGVSNSLYDPDGKKPSL